VREDFLPDKTQGKGEKVKRRGGKHGFSNYYRRKEKKGDLPSKERGECYLPLNEEGRKRKSEANVPYRLVKEGKKKRRSSLPT